MKEAKSGTFREGVHDAVPIMLGYVPIGIAYAIIARQGGMSTAETVLMSLLVYAGASQIMAAGMLAQGAAAAVIVLATFLLNLRHATVIDCRPTTHLSVILDVVRSTGIDEDAFLRHYNDGSAEAAFENDISCTARLGIRSLPTCLIQYKGKALLMKRFATADYAEAIMALMDG